MSSGGSTGEGAAELLSRLDHAADVAEPLPFVTSEGLRHHREREKPLI
jgi:hypothetical protein